MDIGEMFLNFILGEELRPYSGVDVTHIWTQHSDLPHHEPGPLEDIPDWERERIRAWERFCRNWMGMVDSPQRSCQMMIIAKEIAFGDRRQQSNPFRWHVVVLNLPGTKSYDNKMPWIYKRRQDGAIANDYFIYVDDNKLTGSTLLECWRFLSKITNLGVQESLPKSSQERS
jgi:hypothetical protein